MLFGCFDSFVPVHVEVNASSEDQIEQTLTRLFELEISASDTDQNNALEDSTLNVDGVTLADDHAVVAISGEPLEDFLSLGH